ncbi:hypothetical protein Droror1_Dr00011152 [Drosera rotundifolia]
MAATTVAATPKPKPNPIDPIPLIDPTSSDEFHRNPTQPHHLRREMHSLRELDLSEENVEEVVQEVVVVSEEELVVLCGIPAATTMELKDRLMVSRSEPVDSDAWWCFAGLEMMQEME